MPFGVPVATATVSATNNNNIDGLLDGIKWRDFAPTTPITFSFTDAIGDYESTYQDRAGHATSFQTLNSTQRSAARSCIRQFANVSNANFVELTGLNNRNATIRMAASNVPNTAFAYYPDGSFVEGGDAWFNRVDYNNPVVGTYAYHTFGHELGHSLGLKHGQELEGVRNVAMNADRDSMEFSIMTYRSFVGAPINGYRNESGGYAQSLMMYDIAAIQHMYGADFTANATNTSYTFSTTTGQMFVNGVGQGAPIANRVFRTIWDGNGIDTYNLSNYTTSLSINLNPGGWVNLDRFGNFQRANLGGGTGGGLYPGYARGHIFNALQFGGDKRSLIENAIGGLGNDVIIGNSSQNALFGGAGNDIIDGGSGNDTINGGGGNDTIDGGEGIDVIAGGTGSDTFVLSHRGVFNQDIITDFSTAEDKFGLANTLDTFLGGAINPGILGLSFIGGNVNGATLNSSWFFTGAGLNGNGSQLSGIFANTTTGDIWYNPTTNLIGDSHLIARISTSALSTLTNSNFIYSA